VGKRVLEEHISNKPHIQGKYYLRECLSSACASMPLLRKSQACIFKLIFEWGKYLGFSLSRGKLFFYIPRGLQLSDQSKYKTAELKKSLKDSSAKYLTYGFP
jgi:hypothetical protein